MTDIFLEIIRAVVVGIIFIYLLSTGYKEEIKNQNGWQYIVTGFAFLLFGMIIDITDNFSQLNKYIIIGDTGYQAFLEKVVGYLCGFVLIAIGFIKWIPTIITLKRTEKALENSRDELELTVKLRTDDLIAINRELESELSERYRTEEEKDQLIAHFKTATEEVNTLSGMLPICSCCKKIRNDKGYWEQVEIYVQEHSDAEFTHGYCPDCAKQLYPKYFNNKIQ